MIWTNGFRVIALGSSAEKSSIPSRVFEGRLKSRVFRAEYLKAGRKVEYSEPSIRRPAEKSSIPSRVLDQKTDASRAEL